MKITKFVHSCLLVEMPAPINRTALFDPGMMSPVPVDKLVYLDDIFITHSHSDHLDIELVKKLVAKFPKVRITTTAEVVEMLKKEGITASTEAPDGVNLFESPHEVIRPFIPTEPPEAIGVHFLDRLSHPGDSHSFHETRTILALPVTAPWGSVVAATHLALELKPKYVIPIHDWPWSDEARESSYNTLEKDFAEQGITFIKPVIGEAFVLDV